MRRIQVRGLNVDLLDKLLDHAVVVNALAKPVGQVHEGRKHRHRHSDCLFFEARALNLVLATALAFTLSLAIVTLTSLSTEGAADDAPVLGPAFVPRFQRGHAAANRAWPFWRLAELCLVAWSTKVGNWVVALAHPRCLFGARDPLLQGNIIPITKGAYTPASHPRLKETAKKTLEKV